MKKVAFVIRNILKYWWGQDVEKPNIFIKIMNLGMSLFLSSCLIVWMYGETWNPILRITIAIYGTSCFMSFWPVSYLLDEKDKVKGSAFYIFQNIAVFSSIVVLIIYILGIYKEENILKQK